MVSEYITAALHPRQPIILRIIFLFFLTCTRTQSYHLLGHPMTYYHQYQDTLLQQQLSSKSMYCQNSGSGKEARCHYSEGRLQSETPQVGSGHMSKYQKTRLLHNTVEDLLSESLATNTGGERMQESSSSNEIQGGQSGKKQGHQQPLENRFSEFKEQTFLKNGVFPESYQQFDERNKEYRSFVQKHHNLDPKKILEDLKQNEGIDIQIPYNNGIFAIHGYDKLESKFEDYYRVFPLIDMFDFERIEYRICISKFEIPVSVRIFHQDSGMDGSNSFGDGGSGEVYGWRDQGEDRLCCLKRIVFPHTKQKCPKKAEKLKVKRYLDLWDILGQVGVCKLLGVMNVGPALHKIHGFDAVVYDDCVCFCMRMCRALDDRLQQVRSWSQECRQQEVNKIKEQISSRVALLHSMKMVHRDIKPQNIVYDKEQDKYLLCDFGMTYALKERLFADSQVKEPGGSYGYMVPQLEEFFKKDEKEQRKIKLHLCLFYADYYALTKTFEKINEKMSCQGLVSSCVSVDEVHLSVQPESKWEQGIQDAQSCIKRINKQLNFSQLNSPKSSMVLYLWRQKIQLLSGNERQQEERLFEEYFGGSMQFSDSEKQEELLLMQVQQGLNSIDEAQSFNQPMYSLKQWSQSGKITDRVLSTRQLFIRTKAILFWFKTRVNSKLPSSYLLDKDQENQDWFDFLFECEDPHLSEFERHYFRILEKVIIAAKRNNQELLEATSQFKEDYKNILQYPQIIKVCDQIALFRIHQLQSPKFVEIALDVRRHNNRYEEEQTALLLVNTCFNIIQTNSAPLISLYPYVENSCRQAERILTKLERNFESSRVMIKINFIKAICLTNSGDQEQALRKTVYTKNLAKRHFGVKSSYYLDMLLNEAYLRSTKFTTH